MAIKLNRAIEDHEYVAEVWFERGRGNVCLSTPKGRQIFSLWDEEITEAIEGGFLSAPRGPMMSSRALNDAAAWQPCLVAYARQQGLVK